MTTTIKPDNLAASVVQKQAWTDSSHSVIEPSLDSGSTGNQTPKLFFNLGGSTTQLNSMVNWSIENQAGVSVCLVGDLFSDAFQKLASIHMSGLGSSSETSGAAINAELANVYVLENQGTERLAARTMMYLLEAKLKRKSLIAANKLLANADVSKLSSRSMIGMMRSTFRVKKDLPLWPRVYAKSWSRIQDMGENPAELFIGMPSPSEEEIALASTAK